MTRDNAEGVIVTAADGVDDLSRIDPVERDINLQLHSQHWGEKLKDPWIQRGRKFDRCFYRDIRVRGGAGRDALLRDHIVRFPSAPIYGINRMQDYELKFIDERPNIHTLRLLTRQKGVRKPVERLFILHNGLNESTNLRFFYQLADWLLAEDESKVGPGRSACLLVPFPGHLMHYPYAGPFSQTPLSRYLNDAGDLFRHFLRYMIEMHWLLSLLNNAPIEQWPVGGTPLSVNSCEKELHESWKGLRDASFVALTGDEGSDKEADGDETPAPTKPEKDKVVGRYMSESDVKSIATVLRGLLGRHREGAPERLPTHVIGYSLGGFLAQSTFFAWPNMVDSCATICSGGALRLLSPTAFAHSEEWQTVLHSLRGEIEGSMLAGQISRDENNNVAGMDSALFGYFHRIFGQVFLQEDAKSYKQRLSEYGSRMLFISGGEDPIVKTKDVLDASPDEGITMLSVARLTHFLGEDAKTVAEENQRQFWLPEAGGMIARAATWAEELKEDEAKQAEALRRGENPDEKSKKRGRPEHRDLASPEFESALDWVVEGVTPDAGWLFVCRNGIPAAFLPADQHESQGAALHHHDVPVQTYAHGLARRVQSLENIPDRITLCVSENLEGVYVGTHDLFDPHSDAVGNVSTKEKRKEAWDAFNKDWSERIWRFKAGPLRRPRLPIVSDGSFARSAARWQSVPLPDFKVTRLPDVWISLGPMEEVSLTPDDPVLTASSFIRWVGGILEEQQSESALRRSQEKSDKLKAYIKKGRVRIVRVSGTELNPRYRGRYEESFSQVLLLLAHCAAALIRSQPDHVEALYRRRAAPAPAGRIGIRTSA
jgi:pimeloyl-ACP methyl ester carboxylesterase